MPAKRPAVAAVVLSLGGLVISAVIAQVHWNLAVTTGYTSFCNVNERVNCDVVLASEYAYFAGVPVAWWAAAVYVVFAGIALAALRARNASRRRQSAAVLVGLAAWSLAFSVYLAVVAFAVLQAVCLLCAGLYLVNAGLFVSAWLMLGATRVDSRAGLPLRERWRRRTRWVAAGAALTVVAFLGMALWEVFGRGAGVLSAEEVALRDPEFYQWYMALPVASAGLQGPHAKGGPASVVIVEFSDFECAHCAKAFRNLKRVLPRFGMDVQLVFRHFPLDRQCNPGMTDSFHRYACLAAFASECAADQGQFWPYHDLLFENQRALDRDSLVRYAERVGLDRPRFLACLESDAPRRAVERDVAAAAQLGVTSTPTFFLNGRMLRGGLEAEKFEYAIRLEQATLRPGG